MKLHHFTMIFAVFALLMFFASDLRLSEAKYIMEDSERVSDAVSAAVDAATIGLLSTQTGRVNKEAGASDFFNSLYVSFGAESISARTAVDNCVPVIAVTDIDGAWFLFNTIETTSCGTECMTRIWSNKVPYTYMDDCGFLYRFMTDGGLYIYDSRNTGLFGLYRYAYLKISELSRQTWYPRLLTDISLENCLMLRDDIDEIKNVVIMNTLEEYLSFYVNESNRTAERLHLSYRFEFPAIDSASYLRASVGPAFFAFFQGKPVGGFGATYNRFEISNAMLAQAPSYRMYSDAEGTLVYHDMDCPVQMEHTHDSSCYDAEGNLTCDLEAWRLVRVCASIKECQLQGAYSCSVCLPDTGVHPADRGYDTYIFDQILDDRFTSGTKDGISYSYNPMAHTILITGVSEADANTYPVPYRDVHLEAGHMYYAKGICSGRSPQYLYIKQAKGSSDCSFKKEGQIFQSPSDRNTYIFFRSEPASSWDCTWQLQLIDLTVMFGEGNEPTSVSHFEAVCADAGIDLGVYHAVGTMEVRVSR